MVLQKLIAENENKTTEFKESAKSLLPIIKTVIAFANTAGGAVVIGVKDDTKEVIGVNHVLQEEERLASAIADSIDPLVRADLEIANYEEKELLLIHVPYLAGLYFLKNKGMKQGTYVRLGSTNRLADEETMSALLRTAKQISFDKTPCSEASLDDIDQDLVTEKLGSVYKNISEDSYESLGLLVKNRHNIFPSYGAILLFSRKKSRLLPDSIIRCVCFLGIDRSKILDQVDIDTNIIDSIDQILMFVDRHTNMAAKIGRKVREDFFEYPPNAMREAVINAVVHADYSLMGGSIQVAVFSDRIEITNPGGLPFGQSLGSALSGISKIRNRLVVEVFRELRLIERLGSGIPRIFSSYAGLLANSPEFEELGNQFRVTLYGVVNLTALQEWEKDLVIELGGKGQLSTKDISVLWEVNIRTARIRLSKLLEKGYITRIAKSKTDPKAVYRLKNQ